jgi:hypothetical protein
MSHKMGSLYDDQIAAHYKGNKLFGGVLSNNELHHASPDKYYVLNLENSNEGGSHWTCLLPHGVYIDSFGCPPTKEIQPLVRSYNTDDYQALNSDACGWFCMYFIDHAMRGESPFEGMMPGEYAHNTDVMKQYFRH